jgi:hypothetical protein
MVSAQDQVLSLQQGTFRDWTMQKDTMMTISAAMPGEKFAFKPTPPQRNVGEQVLHVVEANVNQLVALARRRFRPCTRGLVRLRDLGVAVDER